MISENFFERSTNKREKELVNIIKNLYRQILNDISNYLYAEIIFNENMKNLSDIFEHIAELKSQHFCVLGEILRKIGVNPTVRTQISTSGIDISDNSSCNSAIQAEKYLNERIDIEKSILYQLKNLSDNIDNKEFTDNISWLYSSTERILRVLDGFEL